jgi:hypothetical protein
MNDTEQQSWFSLYSALTGREIPHSVRGFWVAWLHGTEFSAAEAAIRAITERDPNAFPPNLAQVVAEARTRSCEQHERVNSSGPITCDWCNGSGYLYCVMGGNEAWALRVMLRDRPIPFPILAQFPIECACDAGTALAASRVDGAPSLSQRSRDWLLKYAAFQYPFQAGDFIAACRGQEPAY